MDQGRPVDVNTQVLRLLSDGNSTAFHIVVDAYFPRLVKAAERRIAQNRQRATEGDDVAASVMESLWKRVDQGIFREDDIPDSDALWRFLQKIMRSKITDHMRREKALKRGGGEVRGESVFLNAAGEVIGGLGDQAPQMSAGEMAELAECEQELLATLSDDILREIAVCRLEGYEVKEIAAKLEISDRSVKRKLAIIRTQWEQLLDGSQED